MQSLPRHGPQHSETEGSESVKSDAFTCEECGAELADMPHRQKHAVQHYGEKKIAVYPDTRLARTRQAHLLGKPEPED